jgi:hypothetical protein
MSSFVIDHEHLTMEVVASGSPSPNSFSMIPLFLYPDGESDEYSGVTKKMSICHTMWHGSRRNGTRNIIVAPCSPHERHGGGRCRRLGNRDTGYEGIGYDADSFAVPPIPVSDDHSSLLALVILAVTAEDRSDSSSLE